MRHPALLAILAVGIGLSGCQATRQALGLGKNPPDEFQVVAHAPLSMPPDYNLVAPQPGAARPQEPSASTEAQTTLLANASSASLGADTAGNTSPGEQALLAGAGAGKVDPNIRSEVNTDATAEREASNSLMEKLVFWRAAPQPGTILDPQKEQQRLQQDQALGQPATAGGPTPTIVRKKKALLEGIFN